MEFLVYLGGTITGATHGEATGWRNYVSQQMPSEIICMSPMRAKDYLDGVDAKTDSEHRILECYEDHPLSSQRGIMARDRNDVMRADLLFFNLMDNGNRVSIGSVIEVGWGDMLRKPIVIVMDKANLHNHAMVREAAGFVVDNLDEAIWITKAVLLPQLRARGQSI